MAKKVSDNVVNDIAKELVSSLNSQFKQSIPDKAAFFLSDSDMGSDVKGWVSTGSDTLDIAISNKKYGGYPVGRIIEITGLEASGKSLLAAYALKDTQRQGGLAIYIDTESATSREYLRAIGVDIDKLVYLQLETLEDIFAAIDRIIANVRQKNRKALVTIVVDSVMGATTKKELEGDWGKDGYATEKSIILSKAMRKLPITIARENVCLIFTNQLRTRLGVSFGDPWTTSGGKAIAFASSVRLRLKSIGQIKAKVHGVDEVVGIKTRCIVQKNRMGPPLRSVDYEIYFESGIDNYGGWLHKLSHYKIASSGSYWTFPLTWTSVKDVDEDGQPKVYEFTGEVVNPDTGEVKAVDKELKIRAKDFASWMEANPELREFYYNAIADRFIMQYKVNKDFGVDDVTIDEEFLNEES